MNEGNSKEKDDQGKDPEECDATEVDSLDFAGYQKNVQPGITTVDARTTSAFDIP
jgi:hypothetical protein